MSLSQTISEQQGQRKSLRRTTVFAGKMLFALALVFAATVGMVRTEVLLADAQLLGNPDLLVNVP